MSVVLEVAIPHESMITRRLRVPVDGGIGGVPPGPAVRRGAEVRREQSPEVAGETPAFRCAAADRIVAPRSGFLGFCIRISPTKGNWTCEWTTFLAKGQINVAGPFYDTKNSVLAITGGTGAYRKARGEMNLNSLMGGKEYDFIFHLN